MKKIILTLAIVFAIGFTFTSCKNDKKEDVKVEEVKIEAHEEMASNEVYQCPMDCEKGKTYPEVGNCPVCKMNLRAIPGDNDGNADMKTDSENHEGHNHN